MIISAQYENAANTRVVATDDTGRKWQIATTSVAGDWLEYVAKNGAIGSFVPTTPVSPSALDVAELNAMLTSEGSVLRAALMVIFIEVNKLRVKTGDPAYTLAQFKNALTAQMRS